LKPEDIYRLRSVSDPRLSPDGTRVAFVVTQADEETNDYRSAIWTVPSDGSAEPTRFTWSETRDFMPRWSPDGTRIAFASTRGGGPPQLYVAPLAGGEARKVTEHPEGVGGAVWSPDSERIAYVSTVRGPAHDEDDVNKRPPRVITTVGYKADGKGFVHDRFSHVFVVDVDGSAEPSQLTDGDFDHSDPAWSPDGTTLALCANRDDDRTSHQDLWLVPADGGELRRVTSSDAMYMKPAWSPDGRTIAARMYPRIETAPWNSQIVLVDPATGDVRCVTEHLDRQCGPYFAPREPIFVAGRLLFPVDSAGNTHLFAMDVPDGKPEPLFEGDLVVSDHDAVGDVLVHVMTTATSPGELYNGETRLTRFNESFVCDVSLASPTRFMAGDVEAWIMRPAAARRAPTLLFIHGGPFTQYGNTFFDEFQTAVGAGYAVIYANPRGSSGYGDEWGRAIRGPISGGPGWGTVDYDDLMAVVDTAIERFDFVDADRLGVLGGSYGGFMTAWITTKTDRFKAACAERGIYNAMSAIGTSDGLWSSDSVWGGDPYEHWDAMMAASPITYADRITTPLLLLHSDEDHRCPVEQAEQLFTRLRLLGREVEFVRFPHGTHDLSRGGPPRQRVFRFETILRWFDLHLQHDR
jgi:dipeptidyl aminopeptidase/acylaminoacyl peptidase